MPDLYYQTAVIHQPYFLPWLGYFSKLIYADKFIVLDNVNFTKGSFIDRAQIINPHGEVFWISIPIGQQFKKTCNTIIYRDHEMVSNLIKTLYASYTKARFFKSNISAIETLISQAFTDHSNLVKINLDIIVNILRLLNIQEPEIIYSSDFPKIEDATERIIYLLKQTDSNNLITGSGGSLVKHDMAKIATSGFNIFFQDGYAQHPVYYQTRRSEVGFAKGLSIIDCIFNEGCEKTRELLFSEQLFPVPYRNAN